VILLECEKCGCTKVCLTDIYAAICSFEHLIKDQSYICLNCLHPMEAFHVGYYLTFPSKSCPCQHKHEDCFQGRLDSPTIDGSHDDDVDSPQDLRDDWPHARPVPGGAWYKKPVGLILAATTTFKAGRPHGSGQGGGV